MATNKHKECMEKAHDHMKQAEHHHKMAKAEMKKGMLVKGKEAATPKGMSHNVKVMEKAGYSKKRALGTAYGEVGIEKRARRHESKAMKGK